MAVLTAIGMGLAGALGATSAAQRAAIEVAINTLPQVDSVHTGAIAGITGARIIAGGIMAIAIIGVTEQRFWFLCFGPAPAGPFRSCSKMEG